MVILKKHIGSIRKGNTGSTFETVSGTKMLSIYRPIQLGNRIVILLLLGNRFWGVILIKPAI